MSDKVPLIMPSHLEAPKDWVVVNKHTEVFVQDDDMRANLPSEWQHIADVVPAMDDGICIFKLPNGRLRLQRPGGSWDEEATVVVGLPLEII